MRRIDKKILTVDDARHYARRRLPRSVYRSTTGGTGKGLAPEANTAAFDRLRLVPRAATLHAHRSLETTVLGHRISMPVMTAPAGQNRMFHIDGEIGVARAAGGAGTISIISTMTSYPIEKIAAASTGPVFFQLYLHGGRDANEVRIERAREAGCAALVVTVDTATMMLANRNIRRRASIPNGFDVRQIGAILPEVISRPAWLLDFLRGGTKLQTAMILDRSGHTMALATAMAGVYREAPTWQDLEWITKVWRGPVVIKGVLSAADARRDVDAGAAAVVVSNHGGLLFDALPATVDVLPDVVAAVGNEAEVWVDGGIRSGTDVVKAIALGARAVLVGRAYVWALAAAGEPGVARLLEVIRSEIDSTLAAIGCESVQELNSSLLWNAPEAAPLVVREQPQSGAYRVPE